MLRLITLPFLALFTLLLLSFALSNREPVELSLFPLTERLATPLFLPVMLAILAGALIGGAVVWLDSSAQRRQSRASRKQAEELQKQVDQLKTDLAARPAQPPATVIPPAASSA